MRFEKWEGLGNDFILVEKHLEVARVRELCDRRRGVGADGVLIVSQGEGDASMGVVNADGSRPEMCGNGLRCVGAWVAARRGQTRAEVVVRTEAGERRCAVDRHEDGSYAVGANMGRADVGEPFHFETGGVERRFRPVGVGNPHAVSLGDFTDAELDLVGPALERSREGGINVELCRVDGPQRIEVIVWERGVGRTLACGTGACAAAAAAAAQKLVPFETPVEVALPGGPLSITVAPDFGLHMRGPARRVFSGEV